MTASVGIISSTQGVTPTAPVASALASASASNSPTDPGFNLATASAATAGALQNPKVILDPSAGFITEYLSANGSEVVSQSPSAITVAYLRLGLTADGLTKQAIEHSHVAATA